MFKVSITDIILIILVGILLWKEIQPEKVVKTSPINISVQRYTDSIIKSEKIITNNKLVHDTLYKEMQEDTTDISKYDTIKLDSFFTKRYPDSNN